MTLVETWWDVGDVSLFNCSFCTGQQGDSRARVPSKVLRQGLLRCLTFPTGPNTPFSSPHLPILIITFPLRCKDPNILTHQTDRYTQVTYRPSCL